MVNAPAVEVKNCLFLNFPQGSNALQFESFTNANDISDTRYLLRLKDTLFDDSFTNANVFVRSTNGVSYRVEIENTIVPSMQAFMESPDKVENVIEARACVYRMKNHRKSWGFSFERGKSG
jgi:hypothetical protein